MQLSKEEYARKRIHNGSSVQIENSVTRVTVRHHSASLVMPNSYPRDRIFDQHLTTITDSYKLYYCEERGRHLKVTTRHSLITPAAAKSNEVLKMDHFEARISRMI